MSDVTVVQPTQTVVVNEDDRAEVTVVDPSRDRVLVTQTGETQVVVTTEAPPGPPGPPGSGSSGGERLERVATAHGAISGHRVVLERGDATFAYADNATAAHVWQQVGVTTGATADGAQATAVMLGPLEEPSWSWTPGLPVWLGVDGTLTQTLPTAPAAVFLLQVGVAVTPTAIFVDPRPPVRLEP